MFPHQRDQTTRPRQAWKPALKPVGRSASGHSLHCALHYKFFGPHAVILYGRYDLLDELFAYKVRPATNKLPGKFETGTLNHEGLAGVLGALEYLEWVGESFGQEYRPRYAGRFSGRALRLNQAMTAIQKYEFGISHLVLDILQETPGCDAVRPLRR